MRAALRVAALLAAAWCPLARCAAGQGRGPAEEFRVGDRVLLWVENEPQLSDTFTVAAGPAVVLPVIGPLSLAGVPRARVEEHLRRELGRFIRAPVVRARALIRVSVLGEVARPGYYAVPTDLVLADVLMAAGGPTREARMDDVRVERGDGRRLAARAARDALARGATLDELGLHSGDGIIVPRVARHDTEATVRTLALLVTIPATIFGLTRVF